MEVTLTNYDPDAANQLIFTKGTRLGLQSSRLKEIRAMPEELKLKELQYMANTIPSSWEFTNYSFSIEGVSRAFTHQFVRSRNCSFAQQSMRVTNQCDFEYVYTSKISQSPTAQAEVDRVLNEIRRGYKVLTTLGIPAEDARGILPTNIATNIVMRCNLRTLSDMAKSRLGGRTQTEYQTVMTKMVGEVIKVHSWAGLFIFGQHDPDYFDDIEAFAEDKFGDDIMAKGELLKIVDKMRKQ